MDKVIVKRGSYFDSVFLMQTARELRRLPGIDDVQIVMATSHNLGLMAQAGYAVPSPKEINESDLVAGIRATSWDAMDNALAAMDRSLTQQDRRSDDHGVVSSTPVSLNAALRSEPDAGLVLISVPGRHAASLAAESLRSGRHVMIFSDNVQLDEELRLKQLAEERGLLMMGPDCGTAIISGAPLGFANKMRSGPIGIVGASGTGIQEVCATIDRMGSGITHAIGTGGRDLSEQIGGIMTKMALQALIDDPATELIVVVSKLPAPKVEKSLIAFMKKSVKPIVLRFMGRRRRQSGRNLHQAATLEEAGQAAVAVINGRKPKPVTFSMRRGTFDPDLKEALRRALNKEIRSLLPTQRYVRGAFCGGTLCQEAIEILSTRVSPIYSNTHAPAVTEMSDPLRSVGHTLVDLGDDLFTVGRPHPMIDPSLRNARILDEAKDKETAIVLFDLVLGYGSHADPAKELAVTLEKAAKIANEDGRKLLFVGSITGTQGDYQDLERQRIRLQESGALLLPSNAQAAMFAALLTERLEGTK